MGDCIYCGRSAGFLRKQHKECKEKHLTAKETVINIIHDSFLHNKTENVAEAIEDICKNGYISEKNKMELIRTGWENSVDTAFDDGLLSDEEEEALVSIKNYFDLSQGELDRNGYYTKVGQGSILRNVMDGVMPDTINVQGQLPFNFQKSEKLIWVEQDVDYLETKTKMRYVGGSQGVSIRIAKGLYYRAGAFKGERIQSDETSHVDTGLIAITNKHIYFGGSVKNFRVNFNKIVSFTPYSDGFGIQRDVATAKPQTFRNGDSWFIYNLISNISNLDQ